MVELKTQNACAGLLPVSVSGAELVEIEAGHLTSICPFDESATSAVLEAAHGMAWPAQGRATGKEGARCLWFGRGEALLMGPAPDAALAKHAAVVDLSDAWATVQLSGPAAVDVLARLVPVDLRAVVFKRGHTARTQVYHMAASITKTGPDTFVILVFRSMAATLVHDVKGAMEAVAARG